jgi:hypothetical protein
MCLSLYRLSIGGKWSFFYRRKWMIEKNTEYYQNENGVFKVETFEPVEEPHRGYYAIIPATVRYDKRLSANSKLLYGEITALCNEKGYCWASNGYFAKLYTVSKVSVSLWIKQLIDAGYIGSEINRGDNKQILSRYLRILNDPHKEKLNTPIKEKLKENITLINNTNNIYIDEIYKEYPSRCIVNNRSLSKSNKDKEKIKKMLKEKTKDEMIIHIKKYVRECARSKTFMMNFSTFLNQWPEVPDAPLNEYDRAEMENEAYLRKVRGGE